MLLSGIAPKIVVIPSFRAASSEMEEILSALGITKVRSGWDRGIQEETIMKCYVLATCINTDEITWCTPGSALLSFGFFASKMVDSIKSEVLNFVDTMEPLVCHYVKKDGYHFYAQKIGLKWYAMATDIDLTDKQLLYLGHNLITKGVDPNLVAKDLETYTKDAVIEKIQEELSQVRTTMHSNIEKILERGEKIETLVDKTENLQDTSFRFRHETEELNRCWPTFCTLL